MRFLLGVVIGAGLVFTFLAIWEKDEQKKLTEYERFIERLRKLP